MNILTLCDNGNILSIYRYVKIAITIIKIVVPIILIVSSMILFVSEMAGGKDDLVSNGLKGFTSKIIAALLIFFIPTFVSIIANITDADTSELAKCSQNATIEGIRNAYLKEATNLVELSKETLSSGDYVAAKTKVNKLEEGTTKTELLNELEDIAKKIEDKNKKGGANTGWWWPVGSTETTTAGNKTYATGTPSATNITAYFGGNDSVHRNLGNGGHGAIDIGASRKSNIIAAKAGTVLSPKAGDRIDYPEQAIRAGADGKYNCAGLHSNSVTIDHGDGFITTYGHLYQNTITVRAGDVVEQGQVIGLSGSSGCSTGPHLHFRMELNGNAVDPLNYVSSSNPRP